MNFGRTYGVGTSAPVDPLIDLAKANANGGRGVAYAQFIPSSSQLSGWVDSAKNLLNSGTYSLSGNTVKSVAETISKASDKTSAALDSLITAITPQPNMDRLFPNHTLPKSVDAAIAEYKASGNRIGSDGATADGGNVVTPPPTQKPYTPPVSSTPPASSGSGLNLLTVLSTQNAILQSGLAAIALASRGGVYTPSSTSSVPSNVPASLKQALEKSGQSGSAQWSDDGNSLTVTPNAVRSSGIARSVINGESVSGYDLPSEVKNAAQNFYADLGLTTLSQYESGLKNVSYNQNDTISIENAIISSYLSGEISASDARERIANNRLSNTTPLTRIETYEVTDPKTGKVTTAQREVPLASNPGKNFTGSPAVSGSSVVGSPSAQAPVINIPAPVINVPPIEIAAPTVNVSVPAAPSTPVTVENKIDFTELTAAVRTIPDAMPKREKIEAVADLKKESLEYDKEAKTHIVSGYEVSASPREDRAAYHAQGAKLAYDKNDFKADDIDFGLDDMLSSIAHIDYSGVYDSVMNAMDRIKSGQVDYTPSISPDFITYSYYVGG